MKNTLYTLLGLLVGFQAYAQPNWTMNAAQYNLDYSMIAILNIDGAYTASEQDMLGAFDPQGNVRGMASIVFNNTLNAYLVNLSVLGNASGDTITLKMYQSSNDSVYEVINQAILFTPNALIGSNINPYIVSNTNFPMSLALSNSLVFESSTLGAAIGNFSATFPNQTTATPVYSFVTGAGDDDNVSFTIVGDELQVNDTFVYLSDSVYSIRVDVSENGLKLEQVFTLKITPDATLSIEINTATFANVFPNPTTDFVTISSNSTITKIELIDNTGRFIKSYSSSIIDLSSFENGVYFLKIKTSNEKEVIKRIYKF